MNKLDIYISFPPESDWAFNKLRKHFDCIEALEEAFGIEFSCGDGKYFSDFWKWTEGGALIANWPDTIECDEEVAKYDGQVCLNTPPRLNPIKMSMVQEQMKANKEYRFTIKYFPKAGVEVYYLNSKERGRKVVG
jgi:hypothetical protein